MYKIPDEVIKFMQKTMETWKVVWKVGEKILAEVKIIQKGIFLGDALSPLQFVTAIMLLNHILRKRTGGYKLSKSQEKTNYPMHIDDLNWKIENPNTSSENIESGLRDGFCYRKMRHASNDKRETIHDGRNRTIESRKIRTLGIKEIYKYLGILEAGIIKWVEMKEKIKSLSRENQKATRYQIILP